MKGKDGNYSPDNDIPDLAGKVIFVTGGECVLWFKYLLKSFTDFLPQVRLAWDQNQSWLWQSTIQRRSISADGIPKRPPK